MSNLTDTVDLRAFNDVQQQAIIGFMFENRFFFIKCIMNLRFDWFSSPIDGEIFRQLCDFYDAYKRQPYVDEIKGRFNLSHSDNYRRYHDQIDLCIASSKKFGVDVLSTEMTGWMRMVMLKNAIQDAAYKYKQSNWTQALDWVDKSITDIKKTSFLEDKSVDFSDSLSFFSDRREDFEDCLTIGHPLFDELLRKGSSLPANKADNRQRSAKYWTNGSLVKGASTMILGPSNSGKTTTLTSIILPNVLNEKYILYFTHEQKWEDIKTKLFMNGCYATDDALRNPDGPLQENMKYLGEMLKEYLVYIPWVKAGDMWVESVMAEIAVQQEMLEGRRRKKFDMVIDDYPGKLKSKEYKGRASWEEQDYVYDQFVNLAMQEKFHGIWPVQTNREGYKVGRGDHAESRMVDQADAAGSFGVMQKADNVITLNRSPEEQARGSMRFYISKSRNAEVGTTFATATRFDLSVTHCPLQNGAVFSATQKKDIASYQELLGIKISKEDAIEDIMRSNTRDKAATSEENDLILPKNQ